MTVESDSYRGTRFLVIAATLVIIAGGINQAQSALVSFLVAVFLAVIGTPQVLWLERKRISSIVAALIVALQQRFQEQVSALEALLVIILNAMCSSKRSSVWPRGS